MEPMTASRLLFLACLLTFIFPAGRAVETYNGPRPPKPDVLYLVHADNLVVTEVVQAWEQTKKDDTIYTVEGAASSARTPLAEPIFLVQKNSITPIKLFLYRFEVKGGNRVIEFSKKRRESSRRYRMVVTELAENLYQLEVNEPLENGQYGISPEGSSQVFCFDVY